MSENYFADLSQIDVSSRVEKKGGFTYLSWAYAVGELKKRHPKATWEVIRSNGLPFLQTDIGYFVEVSVTVEGVTHSQIHPVLDNRNKPIAKPNAFEINTSLQRALVKAIALHGLGLYIYAGEDLPEQDESEREAQRRDWIEGRKAAIMAAKTSGELKKIMAAAIDMVRSQGDQPAEDELNEAFAEKLETAKKDPA